MGGTCGMYERQERVIQGVGVETCEKETTWKTQSYLLRREYNNKMNKQEVGWRTWTGLIWLRIRTGSRIL